MSNHGRLTGALDRPQRHPYLGVAVGRGHFLHSLALTVPAQEVHAPVRARRIALQHLLDETHRLEVLPPVERRAQAKTRDHVGHRRLGCRLALVLPANGVFGGRLLGRQMLLDRRAQRRQTKAVFTHAMKKLDDVCGMEKRRQRRRRVFRASLDPRHISVGRQARGAGL